MKNFHRDLRLLIAVAFTGEGAVLALSISEMFRNANFFNSLLAVVTLLVFAGSIAVVAKATLKEDAAKYDWEISDEGVVSLRALLGDDEEDTQTPDMESFEESVADIDTPPVIYVGESDHDVFDVDTSVPKWSDPTPTHEMVLVGHLETESSEPKELTSNQFKSREIPSKPSREPLAVTAEESTEAEVDDFVLDMSNFLDQPLTDPEYILALQDLHKRMTVMDVLTITGKSYGLGARGKRVAGTKDIEYTKSDVKKMILKFLSKPTQG